MGFSDCYMSAVKFFSSLLVIVFATCFLIYYTVKNGTPQNLYGLMVFAFFSGPMFLLQGFVGSMKRFSKRSILTFFLRDQIDNGTAANGKRSSEVSEEEVNKDGRIVTIIKLSSL